MASSSSPKQVKPLHRMGWRLGVSLILLMGLGALLVLPKFDPKSWTWPTTESGKIAPLAMSGGNPYVRALMRTISASESNDASPYTLLYGGSHVEDLRQHPDRCIPIRWGPNQGLCTTAAGRYQFITTTWLETAEKYHPAPTGEWLWRRYSFAPEYQDRVVYAWLDDVNYWGTDIPQLLEEGKLQTVLKRLSGTWTSLGYGIESNKMTPHLMHIYERMLAEEIALANGVPANYLPTVANQSVRMTR